MADTEILTKGCQAFGISVTERQTEQFLAYYDLLIEWNKVMNLTAITEFEEVMSKHFVDSCALGKQLNWMKKNVFWMWEQEPVSRESL